MILRLWRGTRERPDPERARHTRLARLLESPLERVFWLGAYNRLSVIGQFTPQTKIRGYRADFTLTNIPNVPLLNVAIELDGQAFHSTSEQRTLDAYRDRVLMKAGWRVIRFTGSEIYGDCNRCVDEIVGLIIVWSRGRWLR